MQTLVKPETRNTLPTVFHRRPTFEEAKMLITGRAITLKEYNQFRLNNPAYRLPCQPQVAYADKWTSTHEFFGKPKYSASDAMTKYWAEVKAGTRPKPKSRKGKKNIKTTKSTIALKGTVIQVVKSQTTLEDKQTFIALAKKLGVYDQVKPAFKTLFTYDELLELVNL
jgi:hypothetical protein